MNTYKGQEDARKTAQAAEKTAEEARKQQPLQALNGLKDSVVGGLKGLFKKK